MRFGLINNERILATPRIYAECPLCKEVLVPKCGEIKVWHWSHKNLKECDSWSEGESEWHLKWKAEFPKENQEVIVKKEISGDIKSHFADVKIGGKVIEFQNSSISSEDIQKREEHYENMIWVLNGEKFAKNLNLRKQDYGYSFRWKHPPQSWFDSNKPRYIDFEPLDGSKWLFLIKKMYPLFPCGGYGMFVSKSEFIKHQKNEY